MKTVFPPATRVVSGTADGSLYSGAGLITTIGVDPEGGACEITVRDGDASGSLLWNMSTATNGEYRGQSFKGIGFNQGIYLQVSGTGRGLVEFIKKA